MKKTGGQKSRDTLPLTLQYFRVGHRVLLRSEHIVIVHSFKACNVLLRSFTFFSYNVKERKELNVLV